MANCTVSKDGVTIGLDLGDRKSHVVVVSPGGDVIEEERVATTPRGLREFFGPRPRCRVAIEAGTHSAWVERVLTECGHEVVVANPRQVPLIFRAHNKSDVVDAECLARLARLDPELLRPIRHRGAEAQRDLVVLSSRALLVRIRTMLVNHCRSSVKAIGARLPGCSAPAFHRKAAEEIPAALQAALQPVVEAAKFVTERIAAFDRKLQEHLAEKYPETKLLRQVSGVGPVTALAFVLILEDPSRFKKSRSVGSYLGLTPRTDDSGERRSQLRISKTGNSELRRYLVGAAHYILGPFGQDCDLRRYGEAIARRGGKNAKLRAAVAVARKLAVLLHRLWVSRGVYEPLRRAKKRGGGAAALVGR